MSASSGSEFGSAFTTPRLVLKKVLAKSQREGDGAIVRRGIGRSELKNLDPFLMLDHFSVSAPGGFPDHPHRGFETVTYVLEVYITLISLPPSGIIHSEMPAQPTNNNGLQLWINLSANNKMIEPKYQELLSENIPSAEHEGVEVRVIAGEAMGVHSPVYTRTPTMFLDFTLHPGAQLHQSIPESWNSFVYVIEGEGVFGSPTSSPTGPYHVLVLTQGDGLSVWNNNSSSKPLRFVLIGGQPLNEPVAQYGPFVMNTQSEIEKTIEDYQYCRNGFEMRRYWTSI
ncbi:hypothetical protein PIB30_063137 [Stylosanthes scabra]|uniref:Pirin-like protein n=1 Tax=Stylosanthes scabra TaxID=79078 RepID=A0ABU6RLG1_9FABA|nr:hypothetical protein [Stylosanthes scabra]